MPKTAKKKDSNAVNIDYLEKFLKDEAKETGRTEKDLLQEMFKGGFHLFIQESGDSSGELLTVWKPSDPAASQIGEFRKLRNFEPIARCIEFIKSVIMGGAIDIYIDDPEDKMKIEIKDSLQDWIRTVHQDEYTVSLYTLLEIMLDEALTVGSCGAEIMYQTLVNFDAIAKPSGIAKIPIGEGKDLSYPLFSANEPVWTDLKGIVQLKILRDSITRLKLYRDPLTWEANYWTIDESTQQAPTAESIATSSIPKSARPNAPALIKRYLPWQIFWLSVNRLGWDYQGKSVIEPVAELAKILDKILNSVGEGIYRAGNKKYFIVCGTEKRPWSKPYTRDTMQQVRQMGAKNWTTVPVPAGFDIKEIGGTVFEATDVVNYFMSLIAQGMHVPLEVIGDRYARGNQEKAYAVTFDEIERMKHEFKISVEYQLLRRQVWCERGKEKTKQGGKGRLIYYIPELKITSRGLFSPNDRLEKIFKALNVANPISPLVKIEMEKDMAKIFGYDEIKLKTQEEAKKDLKATEELMKKNLEKGQLNALGEKSQGQPKPVTEERTEKRLGGGVSRTNRGESKPMGGSRVAVGEVEEFPHQVVDVNIHIKTEDQKLEVTTKTEPQILKIEQGEAKTEVTVKVDSKELNEQLSNTVNEIKESQTKMEALATSMIEEKNKNEKRKAKAEIEKLRSDIEKKKLLTIELKARLAQIGQQMEHEDEKHQKDMEIRKDIQKGLKEE
jgi:hypothetical protein